jgi:hypothetical protein
VALPVQVIDMKDCIGRYSYFPESFEPLLKIDVGIRELPDVKPIPSLRVKARDQLMDQIRRRQTVTKWLLSRYNNQMKPTPDRTRLK